MTNEDVLAERGFLDEALKNQNNFASLVFDSPEELNLFEIKEDYIKAQEAGNLQEVMPSLIERTKDIIVNGYKDAAQQSAAKYQSTLNNKDKNDSLSSTQKQKREQWNAISNSYQNGNEFDLVTAGGQKLRFKPHTDKGKKVWTRQIWMEKIGRYVDDVKPGGTHEWTLDEIQGLFGYKF
jgi:hypothetical protein